MLERITSTLKFEGQALELRAQRQQVLASNIANADTPEYLARDFDFAQALREATGIAGSTMTPDAGSGARLALAAPQAPGGPQASRAGFLPVGGAGLAQPTLSWRTPEQPSLDRNTVDLDRERANFADNSLRYEATLRFITNHVRNLVSAIRGE